MAIIIFQHHDSGGPGRLGATLRDHGFTLDIRRPDLHPGCHRRGVPHDLDNVEGLLILGGPQNVTDIARHGWMQDEVGFLRACHGAELPVIGICLGAQLIAHSLGGSVAPRGTPLMGFDTVSLTPAGQTEPMLGGIAWNHPSLFSCGQEVKTLPPGATLLAGTTTTPHQVFRCGVRTYAFAQHVECDRAQAEALMREACSVPGAGAAPADLGAQLDRHYASYARLADRLCVNLATLLFPLSRKLSA